jgi:hypothetical protein
MKKLLFLLLLILAAYLLWRYWWRDSAETARGQELFYDRVWVDHLPRSETDTFQIFVAVTEQPMGVFQQTSRWKGEFELFRYAARGDGQVELLYPQTGAREKVRYRAWKCSEQKFDFCLQVDGASRGIKKYYSLEGMEIGSHSLVEAQNAAARLLH